MSQFLDTKQASEISGYSITAIKNAIRKGYLKATRIGSRTYAIRPTDLKKWADNPDHHRNGKKRNFTPSEGK